MDGERRAYRFVFGIRVNGCTVHYASSQPFAVEVSGGQVTYYARDMIDCEPVYNPGDASAQAYTPFDLLAENFRYIHAVLEAEGFVETSPATLSNEDIFESVVERVSNVSAGLLRPGPSVEEADRTAGGARDGDLLPVWVITVAGADFYFGLYSGEKAGYTGRMTIN